MSKLGILITTCDSDYAHFDRILNEFTRLDLPFVVNFDHCSNKTKQRFQSHPLYLDGHENDDVKNPFDERHRQYGLDLLVKHGFEWATYLDTDEVYDRRAPEIFSTVLDYHKDSDMIWCPCLDFWGSDKFIRVDGPFGPSTTGADGKQFRNKFYNLRSGSWEYQHADVHSPHLTKKRGEFVVTGCDLCVLHYGIMDYSDAKYHATRWDNVYKRAKGENPYAHFFYRYIQDRNNSPELLPFDYESFNGKQTLIEIGAIR